MVYTADEGFVLEERLHSTSQLTQLLTSSPG